MKRMSAALTLIMALPPRPCKPGHGQGVSESEQAQAREAR